MAFSTQYGKWIGDWFATASGIPSPPPTIYLALNTGDPLGDNSGDNELEGFGYERQPILFNSLPNGTDSWQITNNQPVVYPPAAGTAPDTITHWSLFDAQTGGIMLLHGPWDTPRQWLSGTSFTIAINAFLADIYTREVNIGP